jgi:hypothetical protein
MRFPRSASTALLLGMASVSAAHAQTVWFSQKQGASTYRGQQPLGIEIASDQWSDSDPDYADKTYQSLKAYKTSQKDKLGAYDYYYRLKLAVPSKFTSTDQDCHASPFLQTLAEGLFGRSKAGLILINSNIRYEPAIGAVTPLITDKTPLLMFSQGASPGTLTPGHGCFLKQTAGIDFPVIRFENGDTSAGKEVFSVNFDIQTGSELKSNLISNALAFFSSANTAFKWNAIAGGASDLLAKGAAAFDGAISAAGGYQSENPVNVTLKQRNVIYLSLPGAYKQHLVEIFPYVSSSMIIYQDQNLSPSAVLSSNDLAFRACSLTAIASGNCNPKTARTSILTGDYIKVPTPKDYQLPLSLYDPVGRPDAVYALCGALRQQLDEVMRLSTVDQMLVRWAFTKESRLQDALNDPVLSKALVAATKPATDIQHIKDACWNDGDSAVLNYITNVLHVQLKG